MSSYLVTGSARGLGFELVKRLASAPPDTVSVVFASDVRRTPSAAVEELLSASDERVRYVQLDVTDPTSIAAAMAAVERALPDDGLDCLINNAGVQWIEENGPAAMPYLSATLAVNVQGTYNATAASLPLLTRGRDKRIVNVSSTLGSIATQGWSAVPLASYKISKAALNQMTVLFANSLAAQGFTVFAVCPGWMRTDIAGGGPKADLRPEQSADAVVDMILSSSPETCNGRYRNVRMPGFERYDGKDVAW